MEVSIEYGVSIGSNIWNIVHLKAKTLMGAKREASNRYVDSGIISIYIWEICDGVRSDLPIASKYGDLAWSTVKGYKDEFFKVYYSEIDAYKDMVAYNKKCRDNSEYSKFRAVCKVADGKWAIVDIANAVRTGLPYSI